MRRVLPPAVAILLLAVVLAPPVFSEDPPSALRVPTQFHALSEGVGTCADPTNRLSEARPEPLDLHATPPAGVRGAPVTTRVDYAVARVGGRAVHLALGTGQAGRAVLAVDLNGDGALSGQGESHMAEGLVSRAGDQDVICWQFHALRVGPVPVDFDFVRRSLGWKAVLVRDRPQTLRLSATPPAGVNPLAAAGRVRFASGPPGLPAIALWQDGSGRVGVLVDRNGNGNVGEAGEVFGTAPVDRGGGVVDFEAHDVPVGSGTATVVLRITPEELSGTIRSAGARRGQVSLGGRAHALHLLDADMDGSFGSAADLWWFGPLDRLAKVKRLVADALVEGNEPVFLASGAWRLGPMDDEGNVILLRAQNAGTLDDYFRRRTDRVNRTRWFPRFAQEENEFRRTWGIDARRPRAAPPHWIHDVDLRAALARAKRENKPLLVDFEADWCEWCKRFDYYVYPDAEVAALLGRFVLLKVNTEFHFTGDFERLGGRNLPFLVFLDGDGRPLTFTIPDDEGNPMRVSGPPRFQAPAQFAGTMKAAYRAWLESR